MMPKILVLLRHNHVVSRYRVGWQEKIRLVSGSSLIRSTQGSFTIEASFVLPIVLLSTISLLFLALFVFQTSSAFHNAGLAADRAAFVWDNSSKNPVTGDVDIQASDGLYWRLHSDSMSDLFRFLIPNTSASVELPTSGNENVGGPEKKMINVGRTIPQEWRGSMQYVNNGIAREVKVQLQKPFRSPLFASDKLQKQVESGAHAQVIDPVEWIRLVDLTRTFIQEIQGRINPKEALQTMVEPNTVPEPSPVINSHQSAAAYLRTLVNGQEQIIQVNPSTKRTVDAMDANQVAHQAYYSFNEKQLREVQMPKDVELLREGTHVKGIVWHFFKLSKQDKVKLTGALRQELERQGIVVVIHE
ncbi:hypothetical protein ACFQ88_01580 [Paenibacillus sp. NPDC056579]|uniref:hypothetical protein n=1 Tax=unclassified Paenibacillus TaxID=185978 RepID=UPI001EF7E4FD|nr:hypothetical protein [Paenibacillus sp. H1-7]